MKTVRITVDEFGKPEPITAFPAHALWISTKGVAITPGAQCNVAVGLDEESLRLTRADGKPFTEGEVIARVRALRGVEVIELRDGEPSNEKP